MKCRRSLGVDKIQVCSYSIVIFNVIGGVLSFTMQWHILVSVNIGLKPVKEILYAFHFKCGNIPLKAPSNHLPLFLSTLTAPICLEHLFSNGRFDYWDRQYLSQISSLFLLLYLWHVCT